MLVCVMRIRHMRVPVRHWLMPVRVAVRSRRNLIVCMVMMFIVVRVRVFMLHRFMMVLVPMRLDQVHHHSRQHQSTSSSHAPAQ